MTDQTENPNPESEDASVLGGVESKPEEKPAEQAPAEKPAEEAKPEEKPAEEQKPAAGPPEKYELTPPDGFEHLDAEALTEAEPILREAGLTQEQAQTLMPAAAKLVQRTIDRAEKAITNRAVEQRKAWADAYEADPDIGGANKARTESDAARAFDHYGLPKGEGLRQLLDESGLGNHPDLIRFVAKVGRDLDEGGFERGSSVSIPKGPSEKMYGPEFQPKT